MSTGVSRRSRLPWLLAAAGICSAIMRGFGWAAMPGADPEPRGEAVFVSIVAILFAVLAALIISRQPHNMVGWLMMILVIAIVVPPPTAFPQWFLAAAANPSTFLLLYVWIAGWSWIPIIFPIILIPLHFPTGAPPAPRWRIVDYLALAMVASFMLITAGSANFRGEVAGEDFAIPNPIGFLSDQTADTLLGVPWSIALFLLVGLSSFSIFARYRRAGTIERQQIKWLLFACMPLVVAYALPNTSGVSTWLFALAVLAIPIAIGIAILRYQLYDIDVIIRKTLLYAILTALLALVYFGLVLLLQTAFGGVAGEQPPAIIVISTLVIAALFAPLRRRVQEVLDRRFFRKKYDAQQVLAQFAHSARDETDMAALSNELVRVVQETIQPQGVTLWLSPAAREDSREYRT